MVAGVVFARQIEVALDWMAAHVVLATVAIAVLVAAVYIVVKALQRWRMARFLAASMISIDELRDRLAGAPRPFIIDVGSSLAQNARPHIPGAALLDLDAIARVRRFSGRPRHRAVLRMPERGVCAPCRAAPAAEGLSPRAPARRRHRRVDAAGHPVEHAAKVAFVQAAALARPVACNDCLQLARPFVCIIPTLAGPIRTYSRGEPRCRPDGAKL